MKSLIQKEWRQQKLFLFLMAAILLVSRIYLSTKHGIIDIDLFIHSHFLFSPIFALLLGVMSLSGKFPSNAQLSPAKIFWTKFIFGLISLLALTLLTHYLFFIPFSKLPFPDLMSTTAGAKQEFYYFMCFFLPLVLIYSTAFLSSLLIQYSLLAVLCTPFTLFFVTLFTLPLIVCLVFAVGYGPTLFFAAIALMILVSTAISLLICQKAISKGARPIRITLFSVITIAVASLLVHGASNLLASRQLAKALQEAKSSGIKLELSEIIPPPVPKEKNAALIYEQAFALMDNLQTKYEKEREYMPFEEDFPSDKLTTEQKESIGELLEKKDFLALYNLIEKAVSFPTCRFELKYEDGIAMFLPHLSKMRQLERLIAARTYCIFRLTSTTYSGKPLPPIPGTFTT